MPISHWTFTISFLTGDELSPTSIGITAASAEDVEEWSSAFGLEITGWDRGSLKQRRIEVREREGSDRLIKLLAAIHAKYGFTPCAHKIVALGDRNRVFGLAREREYANSELDAALLLQIVGTNKRLGDYGMSSSEDVDAERYVAEKRSLHKKVGLGLLSPFLAIAVTDKKSRLERGGLVGLVFEPVINGEGVWKLTSSVTLPRANLPLIDGQGATVEPDDWPDRWSDKYFDDNGYEPVELSYDVHEISQLGWFDVAVTAERVGGYKRTAFRRLVVSQKMRKLLNEFQVGDLSFAPVKIA